MSACSVQAVAWNEVDDLSSGEQLCHSSRRMIWYVFGCVVCAHELLTLKLRKLRIA